MAYTGGVTRGETILLLGAVLLVACEPRARELVWEVSFATEDLEVRAAVLEGRVVRGRCGDADGELLYDVVFAVDEPAPSAPPRLGPGTYSFEAFARDASCTVFAGDCVNQELPSLEAQIVELVLQDRPAEDACEGSEVCSDGRCEVVVDTGAPDAAVADTATDTGPPDTGVCMLPDAAAPGVGQACRNASECDDGMVCHGAEFLGVIRGDCTHVCADANDCVPGWACATVNARDCIPDCPPEPLCTCNGPGSESRCDGTDDDCDGRIDEEGGARSLCRLGACVCGACICDPGATLCDGYCTHLATDPQHCSACGNACEPGFDCVDGACTCQETPCGTSCVDLDTDLGHCGACGRACPMDADCVSGECQCPAAECDGECVDLNTDEGNCGVCNAGCSLGETCCAGVCQASC
jgi:hypothetical protein